MFDDARAVPAGSTLRADVVIVGAGAAGITLARALAGTRLRVLVLESGSFEEDQQTDGLRHGIGTGEEYPVDLCRLRYFGGTTNHWGGWCRPLDSWVFARRSWVDDLGWPIDATTLAPYYERAASVVELSAEPAGWRWDWEYWRSQLRATDSGPLLDDDLVQGAMFRLSPPTRFGTRYRAELEQAPNVTVLLRANARELETDAAVRRVTGVRVATLSGNRFRVAGRVVVLALGGLDVPRLLLLSSSARPRGLGNDHDLVGRYFMDHLEGSVGTVELADAPSAYLGGPLSFFRSMRALLCLTPAVMEREELLGAGVQLDEATTGVAPFADERTGVTATHVASMRRAVFGGGSRSLDVLARAEPKPMRSSRVVLSDERDALGQRRLELQYATAVQDRRSVRRTLELVAAALGRAGLGRLRIDLDDTARATDVVTVGCHLMGTTRMADDPRRGVVDRDLKVHGTDNLFVASSSVFPTAGFSNPTLTIVALTLRLADLVVARLGG